MKFYSVVAQSLALLLRQNITVHHDQFLSPQARTEATLLKTAVTGLPWRSGTDASSFLGQHSSRLRAGHPSSPRRSVNSRVSPEHGPNKAFGMGPITYTFVLGIASGISLPVGAFMGVKFSPVGDSAVGAIMAFGAGALLFAVTVELYAHSLSELARGVLGYYEIFTTIICALFGAIVYLHINSWLEKSLGGRGEEDMGITPRAADTSPMSPGISRNVTMSLSTRISNTTESAKRARERWGKVRKLVRNWSIVRHWGLVTKLKGHHRTGAEHALLIAATQKSALLSGQSGEADEAEKRKAMRIAFALFLGLLVDGVPEGVLMGFLAAEGHLTPVLVVSLFVANFPEAFSSASLLKFAGIKTYAIVGIWTALCLVIGLLGALSCGILLHFYPEYGPGVDLPIGVLLGIAGTEGVTGGAMICCVASVMLPEAFERAGKDKRLYMSSGFLCTAGFLTAVSLKAIGG